jgi:hypothetical protein
MGELGSFSFNRKSSGLIGIPMGSKPSIAFEVAAPPGAVCEYALAR